MSLTNQSWKQLIEKYNILDHIQEKGYYEISAKAVKKVREPRLMAKFDHKSQLPDVFKKNKISILPVSRSKYILGSFDVFHDLNYDETLKPKSIYFPSNITTLNPNNIYSESSALHCANITGMIDEVLGEETRQTISGRMSSKEFNFKISTFTGHQKTINVKNSQIEIDGGYESDSYFMLVEAKKDRVDDFLIRQLYYPYRLWENQTSKKIKPVFFTHSNDIFSFFVYEFVERDVYNSLKLVEQKHFVIAHEKITKEDLYLLYEKTEIIEEPKISFPQADSFIRIVDLLGLLVEKDLSKEFITYNYVIEPRQTNYYTDAGRYLGLIEKYRNSSNTIMFRLSKKGRNIMGLPFKEKYLSLSKLILEHRPFQLAFKSYLLNDKLPSIPEIINIMKGSNLYGVEAESTYRRRASTVASWLNWIINLQNI